MDRREALYLLATGTALHLAPRNLLAVLREARTLLATDASPRTLNPHQDATLAPMVLGEMKAAETKPKIPLAFSTLGCPAWEWKKILDFASQHGFAAIELRGLEGKLDLPTLPTFAPDRIDQTKKEIRASKLQIACVSSSAQMYVEDPAKREKELGDARRFIDLAATLGAPYVRVFGGKAESDKSPTPSDETKARVAAGLRELGKYAGPHNVTVIIDFPRPLHRFGNVKRCIALRRFRTRWPAVGRPSHLCHLQRRSGIYSPPIRPLDPPHASEGFDR